MRPGRPGSSTRIPKAERRIAGAQLYGLAFTIKIIKMGGHRIKGHFDSVVQPVNMFPWTGHIETVCCLYHQKKEFISVPYEPKNADYLKRIPGSATYGEIKEWIQKHYNGMKVSNLYIAQIKDKHGLDKRENYNISKNPEVKVPVCPPEKEQAIEAALRHFRMIE